MFRLIKIINGRTNQAEPVKLGTTASTAYTLGEALVLADGAAVKCGATEKPTHIAAQDHTAPAAGGGYLTAYPITAEMIFEVPIAAAPTALKRGSRVTLTADATGVTATTTAGVATIVDLVGATNSGDKILVKF